MCVRITAVLQVRIIRVGDAHRQNGQAPRVYRPPSTVNQRGFRFSTNFNFRPQPATAFYLAGLVGNIMSV